LFRYPELDAHASERFERRRMPRSTGSPPGDRTRDTLETGVGTLDRAVSILDAVDHGERRFTAIANATGLPRGTAHRLIGALEQHGFLAHYAGFGYRLGPRLLRLANASLRELPLREVAHPVLERLARETGESAQLSVRAGDARICIDAVESARELRAIVPVGASLPLYAGSAAKVFLAYAADRDRFLRQARERPRFERDVEQVLTRGWASSSDERQQGVGSVSAPVLGPYDVLLAVVSVSGPSSRMSRTDARRTAPAVVAAAREIAAALGVEAGVPAGS
jgi:DNA-binding IclR family transcriptional regulator